MRLWHEALISHLPRQQLLGQHRECCALRGNSWNKPHATVNYVFTHSPERLYRYHLRIIDEMEARGYRVEPLWKDACYRGKNCVPYDKMETADEEGFIYPEHDAVYLEACLENLRGKGIHLQFDQSKQKRTDPT